MKTIFTAIYCFIICVVLLGSYELYLQATDFIMHAIICLMCGVLIGILLAFIYMMWNE